MKFIALLCAFALPLTVAHADDKTPAAATPAAEKSAPAEKPVTEKPAAEKAPEADKTKPFPQLFGKSVVITYKETRKAKPVHDGKPGNMYRQLGSNEAERQKNLAVFKAWVGEGAWFLNRWEARGSAPAVTKEQLNKLQLKY